MGGKSPVAWTNHSSFGFYLCWMKSVTVTSRFLLMATINGNRFSLKHTIHFPKWIIFYDNVIGKFHLVCLFGAKLPPVWKAVISYSLHLSMSSFVSHSSVWFNSPWKNLLLKPPFWNPPSIAAAIIIHVAELVCFDSSTKYTFQVSGCDAELAWCLKGLHKAPGIKQWIHAVRLFKYHMLFYTCRTVASLFQQSGFTHFKLIQ